MNFESAVANAPDNCVLAPIHNDADLNAAAAEAGGSNQCWVGVYSLVSASDSGSVNGWWNLLDDSPVPAQVSLWMTGEPNNSGGGNAQTRATINKSGQGKLRDVAPVDVFACAVYSCCAATQAPPTTTTTAATTTSEFRMG